MGFFSRWLQADDFQEPLTGISFPDTIGVYERGKATSYPADAGKSGVAIEYHSDDAEVTVFVRDTEGEADKSSADFLKDALEGIKAMEARGEYSNLQIYGSTLERDKPGWKSAAFTGRSAGRLIASFIYCKVVAGHLVKIRATTPNPQNDELYACLKQLQELIDRSKR
jgi:hypothetical protein